MSENWSLDLINKTTYAREDVVRFYQHTDMLLEPERVIFDELRAKVHDARILDIGVGGGRTTEFLLEISDRYTGIDYVSELAEGTAAKYPQAKILCLDATDMKAFSDGSFDFVVFSYNGLDSLSHEARVKAIREVYRVLADGGTFIFSSHNRDYYEHFNKLPWQRPVHFSFRYLIFTLHCLYHLPAHYRMKRLEIYTDEYAIVNDGDHRFSLMLYYISIAMQHRQLEDIGFKRATTYDQKGNLVNSDTSSHWIHYVATK